MADHTHDEKGVDENKRLAGMPPPVQQQNAAKKRFTWATVLKAIIVVAVVDVVLARWLQDFRAEVDAETSAWLSNPFTFPHFHHKILNGKPAEDIFL